MENEAKKLENEAKKLEIQVLQNQRPNKILSLTTNSLPDAVNAGGGCAWTLAVLMLLAAAQRSWIGIVLNPSEAETLDQYIVGFGGLAIGYYLSDRSRK